MLQKIEIINPKNYQNANIEALCKHFNSVCVFDSNSDCNATQQVEYSKLIAIGAARELIVKSTTKSLEELQQFIDKKKSWLFGYITYDLKNQIEQLDSNNIDSVEFPLIHFFEPQFVVEIKNKNVIVYYDDIYVSKNEMEKLEAIISTPDNGLEDSVNVTLKQRVERDEYIDAVNNLKKHIALGDIYEVNYCIEFYAENKKINPALVYKKLNSISSAPLAAFCKHNNHYLICSSPERFIQKKGNTLISQPIKGTAKRSGNAAEDEKEKATLKHNLKEQTENVMIVDLVRNDLSKVAVKASVNVDELFGVYSFKQVHQLISTVSCKLKQETKFTDIIKATFPMGSMTGAPKVRAMQLIEEFEKTKRGLYSGTIGYINPEGDFDFNVVIRSILYNQESNHLSFMVGSAITSQAKAEEEYEECLVKAKAMIEVLK
jgi:para-aminobenzoate synthetase component 1